MARAVTPHAARWRFWLLAACACLFGVALYGSFECTPFIPWCGDAGFQWIGAARPFTARVIEVDKGGAAEKAGMRAGDQINLRQTPFLDKYPLLNILRGDSVGLATLHYTVHRGSSARRVAVEPIVQKPDWGGWENWAGFFLDVWLLLFAAVLAVRSPEVRASRLLALFLIAMLCAQSSGTFGRFPVADAVMSLFGKICFAIFPIVFLAFLSLFGRPLSPFRRAVTICSIAVTVLAGILPLLWTLGWATSTSFLDPTRDEWTYGIGSQASSLGQLLIVFAGVLAIRASQGPARQCVTWAVASVAPYWIAITIATFVAPSPHGSAFQFFNGVLEVVQLTMPLGLTYAVLSRRFVDMGFIVSRAAVFTLLSIFVLGIFTLLEWGLSEFLNNVSRTTSIALNVAVALLIGLSLRFIQGRAERLVDRVLFRKRHEDETALRTFAHEATFITDKMLLLERTAEIVKEHVDASAVWVAESDDIDSNDPAMVALRAWRKPVYLHRYKTSIHGELAFPMISRGEVVGVLVCDSKPSGEGYAPDETEALCEVAHGVGTALDVLQTSHNGMQRQILIRLSQISGDIQELQQIVSDMRRKTEH